MKVGLLVVATRDYKSYIPTLVGSAQTFLFPEDDLTVHLFTDAEAPSGRDRRGRIAHHPIPPHGFPEATLYRFAFFHDAAEEITEDVLYYIDVDCLYVGEVGEEALPNACGLVAVRHHHFPPWQGTFEEDPRSTAYTPPALQETYVVGGSWGGTREAVLAACATLAANVETDRRAGICAVWHDESHWNRYVAERPVKILPDLYCYPEHLDPPPEAKILCLVKPPEVQERNRKSTPTFG
jgi:histo-blood group ABO system transferase